MARRKPPESVDNHERWLVSYADFITLLFAFFVVMYSTSAVNVGNFRVLSDSIVRAFGLPGVSYDPSRPDGDGTQSSRIGLPQLDAERDAVRVPLQAAANSASTNPNAALGDIQAEEEIAGVETALQSAVGDLVAPDRLAITGNDKWLEIKIPARMLFPSGSRSLLASSIPMLQRLAETLGGLPNEVVVQGHTDNQPIRNGQFPSNWELSTARAAAVARVFEDEGIDPSRLSAVGFGPNRPITDNLTEESRAENRRVVILVRSALLSQVVGDG
ncbi:flagellar motor protein MotB [Congregibacter litoralis]|uniref:Flagellar motor protein n=1 Tax=Congregibacter litoralis KT71 TaxID=314285 RepID=A4A5X7_9GAMM|nr:flagellar motor protein MotB [Congregibacter litoralis]EAQ98424.1 Flagellar motor protein [Congregibacter litoralis KT71]